MENNKKRKIMLAVMLVAIISVGVIGTYAYFLTSAGRNEEQKLTIKTGTLSLVFEDNDEGFSDQIMLGESRSKEFRIRNTGTEQVTTNMLWSGLVNTYLEESLSYKLEYKTSEDGNWQTVSTVSHTNIPQSERTSDYNLATDLTIPSGQTYFYKLTITFNNLPDVNQEADKTAILSTKFKLGDEVTEGGLVQKIVSAIKKGQTPSGIKSENPTFANIATDNETSDGLYSLEDDYGTSYYYRGAVENNYVKFGGFYWRIIRINGDGSVRMIYDGTQAWPNANGVETFTTSGTDRFTHTSVAWNATYSNDAKYVGYMYGGSNGSASTQKDGTTSTSATYNQTDSNVKTKVDEWYKANIANKGLSKYVSDEIFCNDRSMGVSDSTWTNLGYGANPTNYAARSRFLDSAPGYVDATPTFKCAQKNDAFTVSDTTKGNGDLTYPVGLITADEIVAAGSGKSETINRYYYLYKTSEYWYWSLSPNTFHTGGFASVFLINTYGYLGGGAMVQAGSGAVAPVVNIASEYAATLTGSGTMDSPYQLPGVQ